MAQKKQKKKPVDEAKPLPSVKNEKMMSLDVEDTPDLTHFFRPEDWVAAVATFVLTTLTFLHHLAPEVTLQDSGELVTGAFNLGVPHPPGYPLWACMGYIWSHVIVPFGNPAWRIGTMSCVTGGLVVGVMTLMMTRSIRILLHSLPWTEAVDEKLLHWVALCVGVSVSLLFGFNRGVWLWACVSEMRVLNVFSFVLIACTFFAWMIQPKRRGFLYATLLIFGLSMTNHQTVAVMAGALVIGTLAEGLDRYFFLRRTLKQKNRPVPFRVLMDCLSTFWELTAASMFCLAASFMVFAWLKTGANDSMSNQPDGLKALIACGIGILLLVVGKFSGWLKPRLVSLYTALFLSGCAFYLYMPISAATNPPMNWGYTATKEGFLHHITRGQYEKIHTASLFSREFLLKIEVFVKALIGQYSLVLCLFGLVSAWVIIRYWKQFKPRGRSWLIFVWAAFFVTSFGLLTIINPKLDRQEQEITIKFFAPAHGFFAMLIGYGLAITIGLFLVRWKKLPPLLVRIGCLALLALPAIPYARNWNLCALGTYDFGYQFGYRMFCPGGGYEPMETNAVLYGGTDPGRFVPTYMIFCESRVKPKDRFHDKSFDRSDVYIITQNALADNTYMNYIRDHYDFSRPTNNSPFQRMLGRDHTYPFDPIHIPSLEDSNRSFQKYVSDVQSGRVDAGADLKIENGKVTVQGVGGVMTINGLLAQWIFEKNKDKHAFYIEESYVIPWMYPYLRPFGVIMKLEKNPLPSPQENPELWKGIVAKDKAYWDTLSREFLAREDYRRNNDAKKSFSKMRSALAGLYLSRGMAAEAEYAFRQSLDLCPESPEGCFRLADLYMQQHRFDEARKLMEDYLLVDPYNNSVVPFLNGIKEAANADIRRTELEQMVQKGADLNTVVELLSIYQRMNMPEQFATLAASVLNNTNVPTEAYPQIAQICSGARRPDLAIEALKHFVRRDPNNFKAWIDLGLMQLMLNKPAETIASLQKAVSTGGESARTMLRNDNRFGAFKQSVEFQALVPPPRSINMGAPFSLF